MKDLTKAGVAAAGATALLLGGLASTALWSDAVTAAHGTVSTGTLAISDGVVGDWTDVSETPATDFDPATDRLVPGDVVEVPVSFTVDALGSNLRAAVIPNFSTAAVPLDVHVTFPEITLDADGAGGQAPRAFDPDHDLVQPGPDQVLTALVRISFDETAYGSQDATVDVSGLRVTVAQVRP